MRCLKKVSVYMIVIACILIQTICISRVSAEESKQDLTILFTHDLHDNLLPIKQKLNDEISYVGGYARLQSAINEERKIDGDAILVDAGDYSMGTPFQTIFQSDSPELKIMGQMGYDVVTFGNHEFDYRAVGLADSLTAAKTGNGPLPQIVQSNITYPTDKDGNISETLTQLKQSMEDYGVKDYTIIERNGIKIGIFGVMGEDSASKAPMSEAEFNDEVGNAKRVVKLLKEQEKVDFILCLSHSGTWTEKSESEDEILAKKVPEINVIISGHTHTKLSKPIIVGSTVIGSCEDYGKSLGVMKLSLTTDGGWELNSYDLKPIDERLPEDEKIAKLITEYKGAVDDKYFNQFGMKYDDVIAKSPYDFQTLEELSLQHGESTLGNMISDAYIYAVKNAEGEDYVPITAAIVPNGTIRGSIIQGDVTTADAFSICSLGIGKDKVPGYPLISVYLTGKELKTVCEVDASIAPLMSDAQLYFSGMSFTFNPNRLIFNKVINGGIINTDGKIEEFENSKLYRVVVNLYSAQMLSVVGDKSYGLLSIVPKTKDGTPITDYEAQIIYQNEDSGQRELKEWYAVVKYLQSFDKEDRVSVIPTYYNETHARKVVDGNTNFFAIISKPNHIALAVYLIIILLLALIITVIVKIVRRKKRRNKISAK